MTPAAKRRLYAGAILLLLVAAGALVNWQSIGYLENRRLDAQQAWQAVADILEQRYRPAAATIEQLYLEDQTEAERADRLHARFINAHNLAERVDAANAIEARLRLWRDQREEGELAIDSVVTWLERAHNMNDQLAVAGKTYNDAVAAYATTRARFPGRIIALVMAAPDGPPPFDAPQREESGRLVDLLETTGNSG